LVALEAVVLSLLQQVTGITKYQRGVMSTGGEASDTGRKGREIAWRIAGGGAGAIGCSRSCGAKLAAAGEGEYWRGWNIEVEGGEGYRRRGKRVVQGALRAAVREQLVALEAVVLSLLQQVREYRGGRIQGGKGGRVGRDKGL
jgi:hypothetical protein